MKKLLAASCATIITAGAVLVGASPVSAAWPLIDGEIICADDVLSVSYTASSWNPDETGGENTQIDVLLDVDLSDDDPGTIIGSGEFSFQEGFSFDGIVALPDELVAGDAIGLTAVAVGTWGHGTGPGARRSDTLTVPDLDCEPPVASGEGRFTGGGFVGSGRDRVTFGLTIHCDLLLSNNLEVNWNGNRFHTTEHLTTLECSDDPSIDQTPPRAPLDTLVGAGTGRYNGETGYTVEFTFRDFGEPGRNDQIAILVTNDADGSTVLDVPLQTMRGGNLQAHEDQPHR